MPPCHAADYFHATLISPRFSCHAITPLIRAAIITLPLIIDTLPPLFRHIFSLFFIIFVPFRQIFFAIFAATLIFHYSTCHISMITPPLITLPLRFLS
jgi:hypothetical protein